MQSISDFEDAVTLVGLSIRDFNELLIKLLA